jgi:hypothetical protein
MISAGLGLCWRGPAAIVNYYDLKVSIEKKEKCLSVSFKGLVTKTNFLAVNRQS